MTTPDVDHMQEQISFHLQFLGYEVEIEKGGIIAQHSGKSGCFSRFSVDFYQLGAMVNVGAYHEDAAAEDRLGYLEFLNTLNSRALVTRYYTDETSDFYTEAFYYGDYDQIEFGRFLDQRESELQRMMSMPETEKYFR